MVSKSTRARETKPGGKFLEQQRDRGVLGPTAATGCIKALLCAILVERKLVHELFWFGQLLVLQNVQ